MTEMTHKRFFSAREVAEIFQISRQTVVDLINAGELVAFKVGHAWTIEGTDILTAIERWKVMTADKISSGFYASKGVK